MNGPILSTRRLSLAPRGLTAAALIGLWSSAMATALPRLPNLDQVKG